MSYRTMLLIRLSKMMNMKKFIKLKMRVLIGNGMKATRKLKTMIGMEQMTIGWRSMIWINHFLS